MSVPSDARSGERVIKDVLAGLTSASGDEASLVDLKEYHVAEKGDMERLLSACEEKLADAERSIQILKRNKDTHNDLAINADVAEAKVKRSEEQVHFLKDEVFEQSSQLVKHYACSSGY